MRAVGLSTRSRRAFSRTTGVRVVDRAPRRARFPLLAPAAAASRARDDEVGLGPAEARLEGAAPGMRATLAEAPSTSGAAASSAAARTEESGLSEPLARTASRFASLLPRKRRERRRADARRGVCEKRRSAIRSPASAAGAPSASAAPSLSSSEATAARARTGVRARLAAPGPRRGAQADETPSALSIPLEAGPLRALPATPAVAGKAPEQAEGGDGDARAEVARPLDAMADAARRQPFGPSRKRRSSRERGATGPQPRRFGVAQGRTRSGTLSASPRRPTARADQATRHAVPRPFSLLEARARSAGSGFRRGPPRESVDDRPADKPGGAARFERDESERGDDRSDRPSGRARARRGRAGRTAADPSAARSAAVASSRPSFPRASAAIAAVAGSGSASAGRPRRRASGRRRRRRRTRPRAGPTDRDRRGEPGGSCWPRGPSGGPPRAPPSSGATDRATMRRGRREPGRRCAGPRPQGGGRASRPSRRPPPSAERAPPAVPRRTRPARRRATRRPPRRARLKARRRAGRRASAAGRPGGSSCRRRLDVVRHAVEVNDALGRVVDRVARLRVPVARLPDRAGVDEVPLPRLEPQLRARLPRIASTRMPSGSSVKTDGMWLCPKKQTSIPAAHPVHLDEVHRGVEVREDVGVLVERRAVADDEELVHDGRARRQSLQELDVLLREPLGRPARRVERGRVEQLSRVDARDDLVVVAADRERRSCGSVRIRSRTLFGSAAYPTKSPRQTTRSNFLRFTRREDRRERLVVRVEVREDEVAHAQRPFRRPRPATGEPPRRRSTTASPLSSRSRRPSDPPFYRKGAAPP